MLTVQLYCTLLNTEGEIEIREVSDPYDTLKKW